jgi:hypothetical protein
MYLQTFKKQFEIFQVIVRICYCTYMSLQLDRIVKNKNVPMHIVAFFLCSAEMTIQISGTALCCVGGKYIYRMEHKSIGLLLYFYSCRMTLFRTQIETLNGARHSVDRVPGFLSSRSNWIRPTPLRQASVVSPPWFRGWGGHTRLRERRWEDPIWTRGQTLWYSIYKVYIVNAH